MDNTFLVAMSRQVTLERQMDIVANNIANMNTAGFKATSSVFGEFLQRFWSTLIRGPRPIGSLNRSPCDEVIHVGFITNCNADKGA